jgi:predicted TIM-barrel fold metal-dependent hydrolase
MGTTRREFIGLTAAAAVGTVATRASFVHATQPIIDPHFHIWDLKRFRLPWLDGAGPVLKRTFTLDDYRAAIAGLDVSKSVYVEVSVKPDQRQAEAEFAIGICDANPASAVVAGGAPGTDAFAPYIRKLAGRKPVHGVRASVAKGTSKDLKLVEDIRLLGKSRLSFDLLWDGQNLAEAADLVAAAPDTSFILDHCGNASTTWFSTGADGKAADRWKRGIDLVASHTNVACKISGVAESGPGELATAETVAPVVDHCLDSFGPDRVMFAGNWPVCLKSVTIAKWVEMVKGITAGRGGSFQHALFFDNAANWYRLN